MMSMPKIYHNYSDLILALDLLKEKREELVFSFLNHDYRWLLKTYRYKGNQVAFDLVRDYFFTLWVDEHFYLHDRLPEPMFYRVLELFKILVDDPSLIQSGIAHELQLQKLKVINSLLIINDKKSKEFNELICSYERENMIFDKKFKELEKTFLAERGS